jgi:predicted cupin superfamily sugar epimerase
VRFRTYACGLTLRRLLDKQSDIVHYFQGGSPLTYYLITPDSRFERHVLGPDIAAGQTLQVIRHLGFEERCLWCMA